MSTLGIGIEGQGNVPFRVGDALSGAFGVIGRHLVPFLLVSAIASFPNFFIYREMALHRGESTLYYVFLETTSEHLFGALCQAILLYATFQDLRGRNVSMSESVARGLARFVPVVTTSILTVIAIVIGMMLLFVPGIIASTMLAVALPACVVERIGPFASLSRSKDLTDGYKGAIFGAFFGVGIVNTVVGAVIGALYAGAESWLTFALLLFIWITLFTCYMSVVAAFLYHGLRVTKEGIDIDQIAAVFD
jgi:hypothetical protein